MARSHMYTRKTGKHLQTIYLATPQARPGARSLVVMADSGGKSFAFSTPKVPYSQTVSNTMHRESPLSRWPGRHGLFRSFPCNCENWGEGRNTCDTHGT